MRPILDQLENDSAVLLMYLAGELPEGERQQVERRLAADPALRQELERLRDAQHEVWAGLAGLDNASQATAAPGTAVVGNGAAASERRLGRMIRQWQAERARRPETGAGREPRYARWWLYPVASAAVLILAYTVWWGFQPPDGTSLATTAPAVPLRPDPGSEWRYDPSDITELAAAERDLEDLELLRTMIQ